MGQNKNDKWGLDSGNRMFLRGNLDVRKTISITKNMEEIFQEMSLETGFTMPQIITLILDKYLKDKVEAGVLNPPDIHDLKRIYKKR